MSSKWSYHSYVSLLGLRYWQLIKYHSTKMLLCLRNIYSHNTINTFVEIVRQKSTNIHETSLLNLWISSIWAQGLKEMNCTKLLWWACIFLGHTTCCGLISTRGESYSCAQLGVANLCFHLHDTNKNRRTLWNKRYFTQFNGMVAKDDRWLISETWAVWNNEHYGQST